MVSKLNAPLGKFLKDAREAAGLKPRDVAEALGITRQAVEEWEKGKNGPKRERAVLVAKLYKVDVVRIDPFAKAALKLIDTLNTESHTIPFVRLETIAIKKPGDAREVSKALRGAAVSMLAVASNLKECFAVSISDNAMSPDYKDGDICIVDPNVRPSENDAVVAAFPGEPLILRVYHGRGKDSSGRETFDLTSPNPDIRTLTANSSNPAEIIGVVIEFRRTVKPR